MTADLFQKESKAVTMRKVGEKRAAAAERKEKKNKKQAGESRCVFIGRSFGEHANVSLSHLDRYGGKAGCRLGRHLATMMFPRRLRQTVSRFRRLMVI